MAYDALGALLAPYKSALAGEEMNELDPIYALLNPAVVRRTQSPGGDPNIQAGSMQGYARKLAKQMFGRGHWDELDQLVSHESGWNPEADNPTSTAYGLFQFLDSTRENYGIGMNASPRKQIQAGLQYIANRYVNPTGAWDFWERNNYY